jgi:NitT/TauT family transport system ATP-binding protein
MGDKCAQLKSWIEICDLTVGIGGRTIIAGLSMSARDGRVLAVCGRTGIGKTTLLQVLAGLRPASSGHVRLLSNVVDRPSHKRPMVFQEYNLFPWLTVEENVGFGPKCLGIDRAERQRRVTAALERVSLADLRHRRPHQLSGGQKQRVGIARALAVDPEVLLMDEPFSALDPSTRVEVRAELGQLVRSTGLYCIVVTHDLDDALELADHVLLLRDVADHWVRSSKDLTGQLGQAAARQYIADAMMRSRPDLRRPTSRAVVSSER